MNIKHFKFFLIIFFSCAGFRLSSSQNQLQYGEFDLRIDKFDPCKGPKRKDCSLVTAKIMDKTTVHYDIQILENMKPTKVKIVATSNGKPLLRLQADNPCEHLFLRPVLQSMLNITDNCIVKKGHYVVDIDLEKTARTYYHGAFVYGNLTFKSVFYNNECNLSCTVVGVALLPKDK